MLVIDVRLLICRFLIALFNEINQSAMHDVYDYVNKNLIN